MNSATQGQQANLFTVSYDIRRNTIKIQINNGDISFYILTPADLKDRLGGLFTNNYDITNPLDCNEILSNLDGHSPEYSTLLPCESGYLNMQPIRNLYLHSTTLGNLNNIGPDGCQTILKKIYALAYSQWH